MPWRARAFGHGPLRRRASRPQLKRDPLGGTLYRSTTMSVLLPRWNNVISLAFAPLLVAALAKAQTRGPMWHQAVRSIDLTGDRVPETVAAAAYGTDSSDTLRLTVKVLARDTVLLARDWLEIYGVGEAAQLSRSEWQKAVRQEIEGIVAPSAFVPMSHYPVGSHRILGKSDCMDDDDPRECIAWEIKWASLWKKWESQGRTLAGSGPGDSVTSRWFNELKVEPFDTAGVTSIWSDIRHHAPVVFELTYGYESHESLAWSPSKHQFYLLHRCC